MAPHGDVGTRRCWALAALVVTAVVLAAAAWLHRAGFLGISNDDAARTLIAWDFTRAPALDATRSSWLPVHTYVLGAALAIAPNLAWTPRVVSLLSTVVTALATLALARRLGARPGWATMGVLAACAFPWSLFAAWAPGVPEMPCVALVVAALATVTTEDGAAPRVPRAMLGGALLALACGHRYEAWFASAGVLVAAAARWRRTPRAVVALGVSAAVVPLAWLALNAHRTGHAFDFATRVVQYRATQEALAPWVARAARFPALLALHAGVTAAVAVVLARRVGARAVLPLAAAGAALAGLVLTELRGGGATHHVARALLPVVWLLAPVAAAGLSALARVHSGARVAAGALAALCVAQPALTAPGIPREVDPAAVAAGRATAVLAGTSGTYLVELERLDFLWVELASGRPERAVADRAFGAPSPDPRALPARARGCVAAVVSSADARAALRTAGWRHASTHGAWHVLAAPSARY